MLRTVSVGPNPSAVVVDEYTRRAFVITNSQTLTVLDTASGRTVWHAHLSNILPDNPGAKIAVNEAAGRVFISSGAGTDILDAATGHVLHTLAVGGDVVTMDERTRRFLVADTTPATCCRRSTNWPACAGCGARAPARSPAADSALAGSGCSSRR